MRKERITLGLALFGLAGICGLVAWFLWPDLFGQLALWFGAAAFTWKGFQALLGKTIPPQAQTTDQPDPPTRSDSAPRSPTNPPRPQEPSENPSPFPASRDSGTQDTNAEPPSTRTDHGEVWRAVKSSADSTVSSMLRFYIVLIFLLVVPIALGLTLGGIVMLSKGNVPMAGFMWAAAGFLVWYLCGPLRRFWKSKETEVDNLNDVADMVGGSGE